MKRSGIWDEIKENDKKKALSGQRKSTARTMLFQKEEVIPQNGKKLPVIAEHVLPVIELRKTDEEKGGRDEKRILSGKS